METRLILSYTHMNRKKRVSTYDRHKKHIVSRLECATLSYMSFDCIYSIHNTSVEGVYYILYMNVSWEMVLCRYNTHTMKNVILSRGVNGSGVYCVVRDRYVVYLDDGNSMILSYIHDDDSVSHSMILFDVSYVYMCVYRSTVYVMDRCRGILSYDVRRGDRVYRYRSSLYNDMIVCSTYLHVSTILYRDGSIVVHNMYRNSIERYRKKMIGGLLDVDGQCLMCMDGNHIILLIKQHSVSKVHMISMDRRMNIRDISTRVYDSDNGIRCYTCMDMHRIERYTIYSVVVGTGVIQYITYTSRYKLVCIHTTNVFDIDIHDDDFNYNGMIYNKHGRYMIAYGVDTCVHIHIDIQ